MQPGLGSLLPPAPGVHGQHDSLTSTFSRAPARLSAHERLLLQQLAENEGDVSLADVEAEAEPYLRPVCILQALTRLVEQSFVQAQDTGASCRFQLLAPIRAFVAQMSAQEMAWETVA
ncbi:hypothetical protein LK07_23640 [Streptomyces pluripotens]|uniref:Winged helix-turn-helix domain-containing protein n=1 Tax=Streptomyces pluripotens TaxID=1355015 RepID=A0A221P2U2_9ACTN|nr:MULTISPECIES: hypothetical protein [Streptomyces]ASN26507.1 hypothetical protein LK07_23640 [Streptomyces pluripotens]KIE27165.1 hypothetical protein LK08_09525 [Streptomyces sp. MUSC 125]MCH0556139.1 hypothetical protein [Streptomyces sp. MUM 16J]